MPSPHVIVALVGAVLSAAVYFLTRGSYDGPRVPVAYSLGAFIGVYVFGNILVGVVQGVREADATASKDSKPRNGK